MKELGIRKVKKLETADYAALARAYRKVSPALKQAGKYVGCCPHPNRHYAGEPIRNGFRPETSSVPLMVGSVFGEFTSFVPMPWDREKLTDTEQVALIQKAWGKEIAEALIPLFRAAYPERSVIDLLRLDYIFRAPEIDYIAERSKLNRSTWSYLFNMDQPIDGGNTPWHCCDIPYVFHNIDLVEHPHGPQAEEGLAERGQEVAFRAVMAFAANGDPAGREIPAWPACEPEKENVLVLDRKTRVLTNYDHDLMKALVKYAEEIARRKVKEAGTIQH